MGEGPALLAAWWPEDLVRELAGEETKFRSHRDLLVKLDLVPASLNIFPQGRFHGARVKEQVYLPDWRDEERLAYTLAAAELQARILAEFEVDRGALSTVPLGFRGLDRRARPEPEHVQMLFRAALGLEQLEARSGVHLVLAIEPEPWCLLESVGETVAWIEDALRAYAATQGNEAVVRRHIGLCLDLCHAAVLGEDPVEALEFCKRSQVVIPKVQLSSALHARGKKGYARVLERDEPVYLHQMRAVDASRAFVDLGCAEARAYEPGSAEEWRVHFHVPLKWQGDAELGSTQDEVLRFVDVVRGGGLAPGTLMEVETYTNPAIADELFFMVERLTRP
ncbi:MAG: hypothetical protein CSA62_12945 [Planctomycetota bacterium]|nr:MAG: hypothetical protein CSA62_12945 [Planctomycetota bacterium]